MSFEKLWGVKIAPLAAFVLVLMSGQAQAQRQCSGRQGGFNNSLQTQPLSYSYLSSRTYPSLLQQQQAYLQQQQAYLFQQQFMAQLQAAPVNAMQANAMPANAMQANGFQGNGLQANAAQVNALRRYVVDQQMLGVDPQDALQSGWYALQRNQARQAARNQR